MTSNTQNNNFPRQNQDLIRRLVAESVASELKKFTNDQSQSLSDQFADHVSLTALNEAIKSKHKIIKILWIIMFLGGLAATGYFVFRIADEYKKNPTATKVSVLRNHSYSFPSIAICLDTWLNAEKAIRMGLSPESISYALKYLMLFEEVGGDLSHEISNRNLSARDEFYAFYERNGYSDILEFFKDFALDIVYNSTNPLQEASYECKLCGDEFRPILEKIVLNKGVCHRIELPLVDNKLRQAYGLPGLRLRVPNLSGHLLPVKEYWRLYTKPVVKQPISASFYVSVYNRHSHAVKISTQRFEMAEKRHHPCKRIPNPDSWPLNDPNYYSSLSCSVECVSKKYVRKLYNCTVLNLATDFSLPLHEYCNPYYWREWPENEYSDQDYQALMDCLNSCQDECTIIMYNSHVNSHVSNELNREVHEWAAKNRSIRNAKIYFINSAVMAGGIVTYSEVFTYSFETLIGNIGGTCGIWIGVSIMTFVQVFMFLLEQSLDKGSKVKSKLKLYRTYKMGSREATEDTSLM